MKYLWLVFLFGLLVSPVKALTELEQARTEFNTQFASYRQAYNLYEINKGQYQSLPTFAHEEALIDAAKTMLVSRALVWSTYWQALRTEVTGVAGIDEGIRAAINYDLTARQQALADHENRLTPVASRSGLLNLAQELNTQQADYQILAFTTLGQLRKARLIYAINQTLLFTEGLEQRVAEQIRDEQIRVARLRGLTEVKANLNTSLATVTGETISTEAYTVAYRPDKKYEKTVGNLQPVYDNLVLEFALLEELASGIEW